MADTAPPPRHSLDDRLASLAERQAQLEARRQSLLAVKKAADAKRQTRRRIIVGAAVLDAAKDDAAFATALRRILNAAVTKKGERAAIADLMSPSKD